MWNLAFYLLIFSANADDRRNMSVDSGLAHGEHCTAALGKNTPVTLPDPVGVLIDTEGRRILFGLPNTRDNDVPNVDLGPRPSVEPEHRDFPLSEWCRKLQHENELARFKLPEHHSWVDVTSRWNGFQSLFVLLDGYTQKDGYAVRKDFCHGFAARMLGLTPKGLAFRLTDFLDHGFQNLDERGSRSADVGLIYQKGWFGHDLPFHSHTFVPIPGTNWIVHKPADEGPQIIPLKEAIRTYGSTVKYLKRGTSPLP